ncbi:MAG: hypothetical protein HOY71_39880, partial [Nonomuraea sp.]|nr:hypothetical protein [Nonomuraea sp.]
MTTITDPGTVCGRIFATESWQDAWLAGGMEEPGPGPAHVRLWPGGVPVTLRLVAYSPLWRGYEGDADLPPVWDGPVAYLSTVYAVANPLN